jgi:hypothetical protein
MANSDGHEHEDHDHPRTRDYVRGFFSNWSESQGSFASKLSLTLKNRFRAYAPPFRGCCGHPGEPGC